jgi:hypothetical protein
VTVRERSFWFVGSQHRHRLTFVLLIVAPVALLWRAMLGEAFWYPDLASFYFAREAFLAAHGLAGWNPNILLGIGMLGDPQTAPYEPVRALGRAMGIAPRTGFVVFLAWYFALATIGTWAFARRWRCSRLGALLSVLALVWGGIFIVRMRHPWVIPTMSLIPWVALLADHLVYRPRLVSALLLGAVLALGALGGHPQASYLAWLFVFGYLGVGTWITVPSGRRLRALGAVAWRLAAGGLGFCGLLAGYYGPVIAQLRHSPRQARPSLAFSGSYSWNPWDWLRIVVPDLYGNDMAGSHFGTRNYHEQTFYLGVAPLVLLCLATLWPLRRRRERLLLFLALGTFLLAAGHWLPPFYVGYLLVPGWRLFRAPSRWLWFLAPCAATLAGLVLTRIESAERPRDADLVARRLRRFWVLLLGLCVATLAVTVLWPTLDQYGEPGARRSMAWGAARSAVFLIATGLLLEAWLHDRIQGRQTARGLVALTVLDLGLQWLPYRQTRPRGEVYPPAPIVAALQATTGRVLVQAYKSNGDEPTIVPLLNWGEGVGYRDVRGYSQAIDEDVRALFRRGDLAGRIDRQPAELAAMDPANWLLDLTGVERIAAPVGSWPVRLRGLPVIASTGGWEVRSRQGALPRAWLVEQTQVASLAEALESLPSLDLRRQATVDVDVGLKPVPDLDREGATDGPGTAEVVPVSIRGGPIPSTDTDRIDIEARARRRSLLVLSDRADSAWTATVDGVAAPIVRADFLFRGVALGPGHHHVTFVYRTPGRELGAAVTRWTAVLLALTAIVSRLAKARPFGRPLARSLVIRRADRRTATPAASPPYRDGDRP